MERFTILVFTLLFSTSYANKEGALKRNCSLGTNGYDIILQKSPCFVDKTLFIKDFVYLNTINLVTAPSRFGKTVNMQLLKVFLQNTHQNYRLLIYENKTGCQLFQQHNLSISHDRSFFEEHCGKYPVVFVDLKDIGGDTFEEVMVSFRRTINEVFREHIYLIKRENNRWKWSHKRMKIIDLRILLWHLDDDECMKLDKYEIEISVSLLTKLVRRFFRKKVVILIDGYDAAIWNITRGSLSKKDKAKSIDLLKEFTLTALTHNPYVMSGLVNARSRLSWILASRAHNVQRYPFHEKSRLAKYYGLTEGEVRQKLSEFGLGDKIGEVEEWYGGYETAGARGAKTYSTGSIMDYFETEELKRHWVGPAGPESLDEIFTDNALFRERVEKLLRWGEIEIPHNGSVRTEDLVYFKEAVSFCNDSAERHVNVLLGFLFDNGYFVGKTYKKTLSLKIPNREAHDRLFKLVYSRKYFDEFDLGKVSAFVRSTKFLGVGPTLVPALIRFRDCVTNMFRNVTRPKDVFALQSALYYSLAEASGFRVVDCQVSRRLDGERRTTDLIAIRSDGTVIAIQTRYRSHESAIHALQQTVTNDVHKLVDEIDRYKSVNKTDRINIGLCLRETGHVKVCCLINSNNMNSTKCV